MRLVWHNEAELSSTLIVLCQRVRDTCSLGGGGLSTGHWYRTAGNYCFIHSVEKPRKFEHSMIKIDERWVTAGPSARWKGGRHPGSKGGTTPAATTACPGEARYIWSIPKYEVRITRSTPSRIQYTSIPHESSSLQFFRFFCVLFFTVLLGVHHTYMYFISRTCHSIIWRRTHTCYLVQILD